MQTLVDQEFGRLTVKRERSRDGAIYCICSCSCGTKRHVVRKSNLLSEPGTRSCGCLKSEVMRARMLKVTAPVKDTVRSIIDLREQGFSYRKVGKKMDITGARVFQLVQENGRMASAAIKR